MEFFFGGLFFLADVRLRVNIWSISIKVGGPLSSGGPEGDDEGLSLVTYWPNK